MKFFLLHTKLTRFGHLSSSGHEFIFSMTDYFLFIHSFLIPSIVAFLHFTHEISNVMFTLTKLGLKKRGSSQHYRWTVLLGAVMQF